MLSHYLQSHIVCLCFWKRRNLSSKWYINLFIG